MNTDTAIHGILLAEANEQLSLCKVELDKGNAVLKELRTIPWWRFITINRAFKAVDVYHKQADLYSEEANKLMDEARDIRRKWGWTI